MGIFIKVKHWFQKDVSSEQVKLQVKIIDLTEYVLKLINILERQSNSRSREFDCLLSKFCRFLN
ncbi:hypothetical protein SRABI80_04025 [Peribacillus frigoritolerans]|uniref:hypothetical protein n=1 Tax=Peribacillus frigoritolerans TaxID=450367 RepID=UPI001D6E6CAD|nr:hypothetical protein [Peribacillus frigoritolerans]CAH0293447.1 hypothetical protein SRABI80_04025 [Peribacillus frigoritolerans]